MRHNVLDARHGIRLAFEYGEHVKRLVCRAGNIAKAPTGEAPTPKAHPGLSA